MVSTTEVRGGNTPKGLAARKNQPKPNNKKPVGFKGDAKAKSVLHGKVVTSGSNQVGQIIALVSNWSSYIGDKSFSHWAESFRTMLRNSRDDFMPADVGRGSYGGIIAGVLYGTVMWSMRKTNTIEIWRYGIEVWHQGSISGTTMWIMENPHS